VEQLARAGFDLVHTFDASIAFSGPERLGILIGNTRALWPIFKAAMGDEANPLEAYTERTIDAAFPGARIYYAHRKYDGSFIPFQRIAVASGFGALAPSRLVVHPVHGPWFALRAIVVIDGEPPVRAPIEQPCQCQAACASALDAALTDPFEWRGWLAVRDACALRESRYSDEQIEYHYTRAYPGSGETHPGSGEKPPGKSR